MTQIFYRPQNICDHSLSLINTYNPLQCNIFLNNYKTINPMLKKIFNVKATRQQTRSEEKRSSLLNINIFQFYAFRTP